MFQSATGSSTISNNSRETYQRRLNRLASFRFNTPEILERDAVAVCEKIRELTGDADTEAVRRARRLYLSAVFWALGERSRDGYQELWAQSRSSYTAPEPVEDGWVEVPGSLGYSINRMGHLRRRKGTKVRMSSGHANHLGYIYYKMIMPDGNLATRLAHRLVAEAFVPNPNGYREIDHIDQNPSNNCAENLRWVSRSEQLRNRAPYGRSGIKNIKMSGRQYYVTIVRDSKIAFQGHFKTLEEAVAARDAATAELDGA